MTTDASREIEAAKRRIALIETRLQKGLPVEHLFRDTVKASSGISSKLTEIENAKKKIAAVEKQMEQELNEELLALPEKYGFHSIKDFLSQINSTRPHRLSKELAKLPARYGFESVEGFTRSMRKAYRTLEAEAEGDLFDASLPSEADSFKVITIDEEIKAYFARHPEKMHDLSPRKFEELVASILEDLGISCELTPATRDGGFDIYAQIKTSISKFLIYVECKRYRIDKKVGIDVVQRVNGVVSASGAHKGMIVTTSFFTNPAIQEQRKTSNRMELADYRDLMRWLAPYHKPNAG